MPADDEDDDRPLPDLPPLPADPRWRVEHLPFVRPSGRAGALRGVGRLLPAAVAAALGAAAGVLS